MKGMKVWFRWSNGQIQRVWIYRAFETSKGVFCFRAKANRRYFVLKANDCGTIWSFKKEELL